MSNTSAKDLLNQADQLIRRSRTTPEVPVLTELVGDGYVQGAPGSSASGGIPDLTERLDDGKTRAADQSQLFDDFSAPSVRSERARREPSLGGLTATSAQSPRSAIASAFADARRDAGDMAFTREQFDHAILAKLEQVQHSVYSQVMQQLELHATGEMKRRLREALEPALMQVSRDIAAQVAEETSLQVQEIVSNAVENEVARLREQIENKRRESKH
jgi:hypothetical protein